MRQDVQKEQRNVTEKVSKILELEAAVRKLEDEVTAKVNEIEV